LGNRRIAIASCFHQRLFHWWQIGYASTITGFTGSNSSLEADAMLDQTAFAAYFLGVSATRALTHSGLPNAPVVPAPEPAARTRAPRLRRGAAAALHRLADRLQPA
jgi:hypothetical protein